MIDKLFIGKAVENGAEDGGPGSGNWGHRGRPGLVGGSGKGGGAHYRGGRSDIMYVGAREDWLNGLSGETQKEVTNLLKKVANKTTNGDIKAAEQKIMSDGSRRDKVWYLGAVGKARQWDKYSDRYLNNLEGAERNLLEGYLMLLKSKGATDLKHLLDTATVSLKDDESFREFADLLSKSMNAETSGKGLKYRPPENPMTKRMMEGPTDNYIDDREKGEMRRTLAEITGNNRITAKSAEEINKSFAELPNKAFQNSMNAAKTAKLLRLMTDKEYINKLFSNKQVRKATEPSEQAKENVELLNKDAEVPLEWWMNPPAVEAAEARFFERATNEEIQRYLSNKFVIMGGTEPLKMTDLGGQMPIALADRITLNGVTNIPVQKFTGGSTPTHDEIVNRVGGLDKTAGSCASLTWAYIGNMAGYNVLDFRGQASREVFSKKTTVDMLRHMPGVDSQAFETASDFTGWHKASKKMQEGKEYVLSCARHQSLVRRNPDSPTEYQYLELQGEPQNNGWKPLDDDVLKRRFGALKSYKNIYWASTEKPVTRLFDVESMKNSPAFAEMLGYINTVPNMQQKGAGGSVK